MGMPGVTKTCQLRPGASVELGGEFGVTALPVLVGNIAWRTSVERIIRPVIFRSREQLAGLAKKADILLAPDSENISSVDDLHGFLTAERASKPMSALILRRASIEAIAIVRRWKAEPSV
jgi:hypothetical protein